MNLQKVKRYENRKYLDWVKTQTCCCGCGRPAQDPHHLIGVGQGGVKSSDLFTMPMTRECHTKLHNTPEMWPNQWEWISKTLHKAIVEEIEALNGLSF